MKERVEFYPALRKFFPNSKNFGVIVEVMEQYFYDLFDLAVLENSVKNGCPSEDDRYFRAFSWCVEKLSDCFIEEEVITQLAGLLNHDSGYDYQVVAYPIQAVPQGNQFFVAHGEDGALHYRVIDPYGKMVESKMTMEEIAACLGDEWLYDSFINALTGYYLEFDFCVPKELLSWRFCIIEHDEKGLHYAFSPVGRVAICDQTLEQNRSKVAKDDWISKDELSTGLGEEGYTKFKTALKERHIAKVAGFLPKILNITHQRQQTHKSKIDNLNSFLPFLDRLLNIPVKKGHAKDDAINKLLVKNLIFVADPSGLRGEQLGYFERVLSGKAKAAEGLSLVDMLRLTSGMKPLNRPEVVSLAALPYRLRVAQTNNFLVNVNPNLQAMPKWVAVALGFSPIAIYCESRLSEAEKQQLEMAINKPIQYEACRATGGMSSGYLAIGWLLKHQRCQILGNFREIAWGLTSDFWAMRHSLFKCFFDSYNNQVNYYHASTFRDQSYFSATINQFCKKQCVRTKDAFRFLHQLSERSAIPPHAHDMHQVAATVVSGVVNFGYDELIYKIGCILTQSHDDFNIWCKNYTDFSKGGSVTCDVDKIYKRYNEVGRDRDYPPLTWDQLKAKEIEEHQLIEAIFRVFNVCAGKKSLAFIHQSPRHAVSELTPLENHCIAYLVNEMRYNAFLQDFIIPEKMVDPVLTEIKRQINPILARNRWLAQNRYHPPLMADHWRIAARYWFNYLYENPDLLVTLRKQKQLGNDQHGVAGMGVDGLVALFAYLKDEQDLIKGMVAQAKGDLPFYAVCHPEDCEAYFKTLSMHIESNDYFPFNQLGIDYLFSREKLLIDLFSLLNRQERFETIQLFNCLKQKESIAPLTQFLSQLAQMAAGEKWTSAIVINELENRANLSEQTLGLHSAYVYLNDVILDNRRAQLGHKVALAIPALSQSEEANLIAVLPAKPLPVQIQPQMQSQITIQSPIKKSSYAVSLPVDQVWPLTTGISLQMQLQAQQQQTQQQNQQVQKQIQRQVRTVSMQVELEEGELISYDNIDKLLGAYYKELASEPPGIDDNKATLRGEDKWGKNETILQSFFRTWINANPHTDAPYVYQYLTQEAARYLLRCHRRLGNGLNTDDLLPSELSARRSKDGKLILGYQVEMTQPSNHPLTLNLTYEAPKAMGWLGDFRQFALSNYPGVSPDLKVSEDDWHLMAAFSALQPNEWVTDAELKETFAEIIKIYPDLAEEIKQGTDKISGNWLVFYQAWQYAGRNGVIAFLQQPDVRCSAEQAIRLLFQNQPLVLDQIAQLKFHTEAHFKALGQLYYAYGREGVESLLKEFHYFNSVLGENDFAALREIFLSHCNNWRAFLTAENCIPGLRAICETLSHPSNDRFKALWWEVANLHVNAVGFESPELLWNGFWYFVKSLEEEGVELNPALLKDIKSANMLIWMDRLLVCVRAISDPQQRKHFLNQVNQYDLTHGGLPYALQYEGFTTISLKLRLDNFYLGDPTYAPDLNEIEIDDQLGLKIDRSLATQGFSQENYEILSRYFDQLIKCNHPTILAQLFCLLLTDREDQSADGMIKALQVIGKSPLCKRVKGPLYHNVYSVRQPKTNVSLLALSLLLNPKVDGSFLEKMKWEFRPTYLELVTILFKRGVGKALAVQGETEKETTFVEEAFALLVSGEDLTELYDFSQLALELSQKPYTLNERLGLKLAALLGERNKDKIQQLFDLTRNMQPAAQRGFLLLVKQLFSLDWQNSNLTKDGLLNSANWDGLLHCIQTIKQNLHDTYTPRQEFITTLRQKGIIFQYDDKAIVRVLTSEDRILLRQSLSFFVEQEDSIWAFLQAHVVVENNKEVQKSLAPFRSLFGCLRKLKLNPKSALDEIDLILKVLRQAAKPRQYWHVNYLCSLLKALEPQNNAPYPVEVLKALSSEPFLLPKKLEDVSPELEPDLANVFRQIIKNTVFDPAQQAQLCQLALHEYETQGGFSQHPEITATLAAANCRSEHRTLVLSYLLSSQEVAEDWKICKALLDHEVQDRFVKSHWSIACAYWLHALNDDDATVKHLFNQIRSKGDEHTRDQLLHIVAFSALHQGLKSDEQHHDELQRKAPKFIEKLMRSPQLLNAFAACYPGVPCPTMDDLLRMTKRVTQDHLTIDAAIKEFKCHPYSKLWADYEKLAVTREADFQRMLQASRCVVNGKERPLTLEEAVRLTLMFSYLKQLEDGSVKIAGQRIKDMTPQELAVNYQALSAKEKTDEVTLQLWALRFLALGHATNEYPHLAQQFISIAHDIGLNSRSKILCLGTGEGKSHFVALRAAHYVAMDKKAVIQTAKLTLAEGDQAKYQAFFDCLGIASAYLTQNSGENVVRDHQVVYTTAGDLSLYLDQQAYEGNPVEIKKEGWVGLFDEFDFIYFDEGIKTEYNFAIEVGKNPQQMRWFYRATHSFYQEHANVIKKLGGVNKKIVQQYVDYLLKFAGTNEAKLREVERLIDSPEELIAWLQASHNAHQLVRGHDFAVVEENLLRRIVPLSLSHQKMEGASFSDGTQQLLAERLNREALRQGDVADFEIPPLSEIISTQNASTRLHELFDIWEGYTGTLSPLQAEQLHHEMGTQVFRMPTNRPCLRTWNKPQFFETREDMLKQVIQDTQACFEQKESILFACKDDVEVEALQAELAKKLANGSLDEGVYHKIIFFTNESKQTSKEILKEKKGREKWQRGEQGEGVGLMASGLGRGDNLGVNRVFLFYAENKNDELQKGGRTARNGKHGTVSPFYVWSEIEADYKALLKWMENEDKNIHQKIKSIAATEPDKKVRTYERLLYLRERSSILQNETKLGYQNALGGYSNWVMRIIGQLAKTKQIEAKLAFRNRWVVEKKNIAKAWRDISTDPNLVAREKIVAICEKITASSETLLEHYKTIVGSDLLKLSPYEAIPPVERRTAKAEFVASQVGSDPTTHSQLMASALLPLKIPVHKWEIVIQKLTQLEKNHPKKYKIFAEKARTGFDSLEALINTIDTFSQEKTPFSQIFHYTALHQQALEKLYDAYPAFFAQFAEKAAILPTLVRESLVESLLATPTLCQQSNSVLAVIDFLAQFPADQQAVLGKAYAVNLPTIVKNKPLTTYLSGPEIAFEKRQMVWRFVQRYALDDKQLTQLVPQVIQAINGADSETRIAWLNEWESLARNLSKEDSSVLLESFCRVMQQCSSKEEAWLFNQLLKKTKYWWNKDRQGRYQPQLMRLWQQLAKYESPLLFDLLKPVIHFAGKEWFILPLAYTKLDKRVLMHNRQWMYDELAKFNDLSTKKQERLASFTQRMEQIDLLSPLYQNDEQAIIADNFRGYYRNETLHQTASSPYLLEFANDFYALVKQHQGDVSQIVQQPLFKQLFEFTSNDPTCRQRRIAWMQLLHYQVFVSGDGSAFWTDSDNDTLLKQCFAEYERHTREILMQGEAGSMTGDLTSQQHAKLLHLSQELQEITGEAQPVNRDVLDPLARLTDNEAKIDDLKQKMMGIIRQYHDVFSKSSQREGQLKQLENDLTVAFTRRYTHQSRYESLLMEINHARSAAISNDQAINKDRHRWFKFNREGSRYLDTLDSLSQLVLKHWVADTDAIPGFCHYQEKFVERLRQSVLSLQAVLGDPVEGPIRRSDNTEFTELKMVLREIVNAPEMNPQKVIALLTYLQHDLPRLPGYVTPLAQTLEMQSKAFVLHQDQQMYPPEEQPKKQKERELLAKVIHHLDSYEATWAKSSSRIQQFFDLRLSLVAAMMNPEPGYYKTLLKTIKQARETAVRGDIGQWLNSFFDVHVHRGGHSRYLDLLTQLEESIVGEWVKNEPDAQQAQCDKAYLEKKLQNAKASLCHAVVSLINKRKQPRTFYEMGLFMLHAKLASPPAQNDANQTNTQAGDPWLLPYITEILAQNIAERDRVAPLDEKGISMEGLIVTLRDPVNNLDQLNHLLNSICDLSFPVELNFLANEVLDAGKKLTLHYNEPGLPKLMG